VSNSSWGTSMVFISAARFRAEPAMRRSLWLLPALGVVGLSGCGSASTVRSIPTAPVEIHISLDQTRVDGGTALRGQATLTNSTSKSVLVQQCALDGWLFVGLTNRKFSFNPGSPLIACAPSIRLHPGSNRFPITVATTYQECVQPGGQSTTYAPPCVHAKPPPLPAGSYTTKVVTYGLPARTSTSRPIKVTVTG
jgi:hypothetical protein